MKVSQQYKSLSNREVTILKKIHFLREELYTVRNALKAFSNSNIEVITLQPSDIKQLGKSWKQRCMKCVILNDRLMKTVEIMECAVGEIKNKDKRDKTIITVGLALNTLVKEGKLKKKIIQGVKGHLFGTPEMFNNDEPKPEYLKD